MSLQARVRTLTRVLRDLPDLRPCLECGGRRKAHGHEEGAARCVHRLADGTERVDTLGLPDAKFCPECERLLDEQGQGVGPPFGEGPVFHLREAHGMRGSVTAAGESR